MFDIDVPGGIRFQESEVLSPGNGFLTFDTGKSTLIFYSLHVPVHVQCTQVIHVHVHVHVYTIMRTCVWQYKSHCQYTEWCKVGVGICYDMRFQELASIYSQKGAPAFN